MADTLEAIDRQEWEAFAHGEWIRFSEGSNAVSVWDHGKVTRAGRHGLEELDAWKGPWRNVVSVCTREFREEVEAGRVVRITWGEWQARKRAERERERLAAGDVAHVLANMEFLRDLSARRGEMISAARAAGTPWADICEALGISRSQANVLLAAYDAEVI